MPPKQRRWTRSLAVIATGLLGLGGAAWWGLSYQPAFYRALQQVPGKYRHRNAERFVASSLQLRNDIVNETHWEAAFSDEEVNAWLAEDLVTSFADQIPPGVSDPRLLFETDRVTLAFRYQEGPVNSVVWAVVRVSVPQDNEVALTLEKIRVGALPIPSHQLIERITAHARDHGLDLRWGIEDGLHVATIRYAPSVDRHDIVLETVSILQGSIRLAGRSDKSRGQIADPKLPARRTIQSRFPSRNAQRRSDKGISSLDPGTSQISARPRNV